MSRARGFCAALALAIAFGSTQMVMAATSQSFLFYGQSSGISDWSVGSSWRYSNGASGSSGNWKTTSGNPGGFDYDVYFRSPMSAPNGNSCSYNSSWDHVVTFTSAQNIGKTSSQPLHLDAGSSAENPIVFAATRSDYGLTSSSTLNIAETADGYLQIDSGTYSFGHVILANGYGKTGVLTMNGGTLKILNNYARIGCAGGTGILTVKTGAVFDNSEASNKNFTLGQDANSSGTLNVEGGEVTVKGYISMNYNAGALTSTVNVTDGGVLACNKILLNNPGQGGTINIDGGTLKAYGSNASYFSSFLPAHNSLNVYIGANGVTIATDGHDITIGEDFQEATSSPGGGLTVTGGGTATFTAGGNLTGAFAIGDGTTLRYFDQDSTVADYGIASLSIGAGATIYLDANATGCDTFNAATTNISATAENPATIELVFSAVPAAGRKFALFETDSAAKFNVNPKLGVLTLPHEVAVEDGVLTLTITADDYTWNGTGTNWGDAGAWTKNATAADWSDGNNAIFDTAGRTAILAADVSAAEVRFTANATIATNGTDEAALTIASAKVDVAAGANGTISAPVSGALEKTGAGTLTLGASRSTGKTVLSAGTLVFAPGATIAPVTSNDRLQIGIDSTPVVFDYGGQTLTWHPGYYLGGEGAGRTYVTLTNGVFQYTANGTLYSNNSPKELTIAKDAVFSNTGNYEWYTWNDSAVRIAGGRISLQSVSMMNYGNGTMAVVATDGGVFEVTNSSEFLASTEQATPKLNMSFTGGSVFRTANADLAFGYSSNNKNAESPGFVLAMTNSVLDVGTGVVILGHNVVGANTAGGYTADFENCVITAKCFKVYHDRPANSARFNNSRFVLTASDDWSLEANPGFDTQGGAWASATPVTIGAGGLVIDTQNFNGQLKCNPQGDGAITKTGSGKLTVARNQTATAALNVNEGAIALDGVSVARPITVASGATLTVNAASSSSLESVTFEAGSTLNIASYAVGVTSLEIGSLTLPAEGTISLTFNGGAFPTGAYAIYAKSGVTAADGAKFAVSAGDADVNWQVRNGVLMLLVGSVWTGAAEDGDLSNDANWAGGVKPDGEAVICCEAPTTLTKGSSFAATSIKFAPGCAALTISGDFTTLTAIVNNSASAMTFTGLVDFGGNNIDVIQNTGAVIFQGGATGTWLARGMDLHGTYTFTGTGDRTEHGGTTVKSDGVYNLLDGTFYKHNGDFSVEAGGKVEVGAAKINRSSEAKLLDAFNGEFKVNGEFSVSASGANSYITHYIASSGAGTFIVNGIRVVTYAALVPRRKTIVGGGGIIRGNGYVRVYNSGTHEFGSYADWTMYHDDLGNTATDNPAFYKHNSTTLSTLTFNTTDYYDSTVARLITCEAPIAAQNSSSANNFAVTVNGIGKFVFANTSNGTTQGDYPTYIFSGGLTVNDSATVEVKANAWPGKGAVTLNGTSTLLMHTNSIARTGAVTVNNGATLEVAETSGTASLGGALTIESGAALKFKLNGESNATLALTSLTLNATTESKALIKFAAGSTTHIGQSYTLTSGGKFSEGDEEKFALPEGDGGKLTIVEGNLVYTAPNYFYIKIAEGSSGDLKVPLAWIYENTAATGTSSAADISGALVENGANGIPVWQSYCLGLNPKDVASVILCDAAAVQPSDGTVNITVKNLNVPEDHTGVEVTAYLESKSGNGWSEVTHAPVASGSATLTSPELGDGLRFFA